MEPLARLVLVFKAASDYRAGASIQQIADKYDVPYATVQKALKDGNVKMRRVGRKRADD